jgi:hypothetical protein
MIQNEPRHHCIAANMPPTIGPLRWQAVKVPCEIAMMRVRKRESNTPVISAMPLPETSPPAHPCTPRAAISEPMSGASAQHTVPSAKAPAPSV